MKLIKCLINVFNKMIRDDKCEHMYYPEYGIENKPIGQRCRLCGKFNSLEDLGIKL